MSDKDSGCICGTLRTGPNWCPIHFPTPQGTPYTQWIKPKFPATTPEEWREFGKTAAPDKCPTCGKPEKWTDVIAANAWSDREELCHDPWHSSETTGLFPPNSSKNWQKEK